MNVGTSYLSIYNFDAEHPFDTQERAQATQIHFSTKGTNYVDPISLVYKNVHTFTYLHFYILNLYKVVTYTVSPTKKYLHAISERQCRTFLE